MRREARLSEKWKEFRHRSVVRRLCGRRLADARYGAEDHQGEGKDLCSSRICLCKSNVQFCPYRVGRKLEGLRRCGKVILSCRDPSP